MEPGRQRADSLRAILHPERDISIEMKAGQSRFAKRPFIPRSGRKASPEKQALPPLAACLEGTGGGSQFACVCFNLADHRNGFPVQKRVAWGCQEGKKRCLPHVTRASVSAGWMVTVSLRSLIFNHREGSAKALLLLPHALHLPCARVSQQPLR